MSRDAIGIIGLGDLGGRLTLQAEAAGFDVVAYEPFQPKTPKEAVDPEVTITGLTWPPRLVGNIGEVTSRTTMIHWCTGLDYLKDVNYLPDDATLVLHDSVMSSSNEARRVLKERPEILGHVSIAHLLMNPEATAFVASDTPLHEEAAAHLDSLGLKPVSKDIETHDILMAHSQARLAWGVLFDLPALKCTPLSHLTPSGVEYLEALKQRDAAWTPQTLSSIFRNPHIPEAERIQALARIDELQNK